MRYQIELLHDDQGRMVPWLVVEVGECTMDCEAAGNTSGAHRPGCGLQPVAPIHQLRVALQHHDWWKAQCARASGLMEHEGNRVVAVGGGSGEIRATGEAVGYADFVTVVIRKDDGERLFWSANLVHPAAAYTPECQAELTAGGTVDVSHGGAAPNGRPQRPLASTPSGPSGSPSQSPPTDRLTAMSHVAFGSTPSAQAWRAST